MHRNTPTHLIYILMYVCTYNSYNSTFTSFIKITMIHLVNSIWMSVFDSLITLFDGIPVSDKVYTEDG